MVVLRAVEAQAEEQAEVTRVINLTPIPTKIQERLKEKMSVLNRERQISSGELINSDKLKLEEMMTRTTFIRMTSGQDNPVILMGGKLDDDGNMPEGYSEIYGPRSYTKKDRDKNDNLIVKDATFSNELRRPTPGIKNIDVTFKGGLKTNREATISWTCWSWEEIDTLTPHFLAHGKTVLLEWGWVYDKTTLQNLPPFLIKDPKGDGSDVKIDASVYDNYQAEVVENNGDFDLMAGVIKNFEYTTREDGGFDCQTILTSVGINLIQKEGAGDGGSDTNDKSKVFDLDLKDNEKVEKFFRGKDIDALDDEVISINFSLSLKLLLSNIDEYIRDTYLPIKVSGGSKKFDNTIEIGNGATINPKEFLATPVSETIGGTNQLRQFIVSETDKFIFNFSITGDLRTPVIIKTENVWIRWGWFEDNILSKFLSLTSADKDKPIHTKFRSVEKILDPNLKEKNPPEYESVRIRNHENLETVDINSYLLPGQFFPASSRTIKVPSTEVKSREIQTEDFTILGDDNRIVQLKTALDKFTPFATESTGKGQPRFTDEGETTPPKPGRYGYLRNMLINTKVIKSAFDANLGDKGELQSTTPINILESIENMFRNINGAGGLNMWNFQLKEDEQDGGTIKIIDDATTYFGFDNVKENQTKFDNNNKVVGDTGIFYFPVWQSDSIVKRQNITTKIPSAIQLATMYGANVNPVQEMDNHATSFDAVGVAAGAFNNDSRDKNLEKLNIAIKNKDAKKIGNIDADDKTPITINGGDESVLSFLQKNQNIETLEKIYTELDEKVSEDLEKEADLNFDEELRKTFNPSLPIPSSDFLSNEELSNLFYGIGTSVQARGMNIKSDRKFLVEQNKKIKSFATSFSQKYSKKGKMKKKFLEFVNESIIGFQESANENLPILIPFEIELDIDGIGGIYPANSFHSTYVPNKYQEAVIFQAKDVNHRVDSTGWTTTLAGVMRSTLNAIFERNGDYKEFKEQYMKNYKSKLKATVQKSARERQKSIDKSESSVRGWFSFVFGAPFRIKGDSGVEE